jgi:hypothetical protein
MIEQNQIGGDSADRVANLIELTGADKGCRIGTLAALDQEPRDLRSSRASQLGKLFESRIEVRARSLRSG